MNTSKLLLSIAFSFISLAILTASILAVFPACNLNLFGRALTAACTSQDENKASSFQNAEKDVGNLLKRIRDLEIQLATKSCAYVEYQNKGEINRDAPKELEKTDLDAWKRKDLGALAGCWALTGSAQTFTRVGCTGENCPQARSSNAVYCFDSVGIGNVKTEIDGKFCEAELKAKFSQARELVFRELSDQKCPIGTRGSDGKDVGAIISRDYTCKINVSNKAECEQKGRLSGDTKKIILVRTQDE